MTNTPVVSHISECFIKPKSDVEDARNPVFLAPTELAALSVNYNQKGLLFTKPCQDPMNNLLDSLKHSLSVALVHFYPLVGQLETQIDEDRHTSLIFIDCNKGPGARFIHASLDMTISDILSPRDVPCVVQSFFDHVGAVNHDGHTVSLLSIQVTELLDGIFIGCSMNHVCADGTSLWHFLNTWSEIHKANGEMTQISRPPIHKRWFLDGTGPMIKLPFTNPDEFISRFEAPKLRERFFRFSAESIAKLKAKANADCKTDKISSFQALSALVWRSLTRARALASDTETRCKLHVNFRGRLEPPLSDNHVGNLVQTIQVSSRAGELLGQNLGWGALLVHRAVAGHGDKAVRFAVERWVKSPCVYQLGLFLDLCTIMMGSSPRFDMYGPEFGMGRALAVLSGVGNKFDGKVTSYPGRDGGASVDLEISLRPDLMCKLELDEELMGFVYGGC